MLNLTITYCSEFTFSVFILLLPTCALCLPLHMCVYMHRACVCFARVWCRCQPRRESCQRHSIKGDYAVCRCASLCLPNDWLLTFSPCLLPAGGTGASEDQLPPVLLPRSLAETLLLPARWALRVEQAVEPPVSLLSHLPYTHLYIHTHRLSALPEAFAVSSYVSSISAHFQPAHFMFCLFFGGVGLVLVLFSFSSNSCFSLQAVFVCLQS